MDGYGKKERNCPRCRHLPLIESTAAQGIAVDRCTKCGGVWYDRGEINVAFPALKRATQGAADSKSIDVNAALMPCPVCAPRTLADRNDASDATIVVWDCNACGGTWVDKEIWAKLYKQKRAAETPVVTPRGPAFEMRLSDPLAFSRSSFDSPWINVGVPPVMLAISGILALTGFDKLLYFARIMLHELGHAAPAWFSGRAALPLPFGITFIREEQAWWTSLCLAFLLGVFGYRSLREGHKVATGLAVVLLAFQVYFTWVVKPFTSMAIATYGGIAGEFILSTALIILYHHPLPDRLRWDFWRFVTFVPAMVTFVGAFAQWIAISNKVAAMPTTTMFGVPGDGQSDIEKLINQFGWSADQISSISVGIGILCAIVIAVHYAYALARSLFFSDE
jgi:Zn-finger nucleic acid-binding protein